MLCEVDAAPVVERITKVTSDTHNGDVVTRTLLLRHPGTLGTDHAPMLGPGHMTPGSCQCDAGHRRGRRRERGVITTDYSGTRGSTEENDTEKLPELLTLLRAAGAES